jgi:two-component system sensor histidine kinase DesK
MSLSLASSTIRRWFPPPPATRGWPPYLYLVYLGPVFFPVVTGRVGLGLGVAIVALVVVFLASYFKSLHADDRGLLRHTTVQAAIGAALGPWHVFASVFGVYAACTVARHSRARVAWIGMLLVVGVLTGWFWALHASMAQILGVAIVAPVIGAVTLHEERARRADHALAEANARMADLATTAERERIARDLHDVLGHTLSLVVLKAQVAKRLVVREPVTALRELHELEEAARSALAQVRQTIRGYRATLDEEVQAARAILAAAGVDVAVVVALSAPDTARDGVLAPVLRELVTNVARHAGATRCEIRIAEQDGVVHLTVADDGSGGAQVTGNGLRGVADRVRSAGGTIDLEEADASRCTGARPGTRVTVSLPVANRSVHRTETAA